MYSVEQVIFPQFDGLLLNETMSQDGETDDKKKPQELYA